MKDFVVDNKTLPMFKQMFIHVELNPSFDIKEHIQQAIISKELPINLYFYEYNSELNKLDGNWNIFLDSRKAIHEIWRDFLTLIDIYNEKS